MRAFAPFASRFEFRVLASVRRRWPLLLLSLSMPVTALTAAEGSGVDPLAAAIANDPVQAPAEPLSLWYDQPAKQWVEALPLGNGRLGAMVFGGIEHERIQLNEDTLWAGGPYDPSHPDARPALPEIRRLLAAGQYAEAQALANTQFMARPLRQMPYQTIGDLLITMPGGDAVTNYRRDLNLDTAVARTQFLLGSTAHVREVFVSPVDQVVVIRLWARNTFRPEWTGQLNATLTLQSPLPAAVSAEGAAGLVMDGVNGEANGVPGALKWQTRLRVHTEGGSVEARDGQLHIHGADSAVIVLAAATSYRRFDDVSGDPARLTASVIEACRGRSYEQMKAVHVAEHQRLFRRVALDLGTSAAAARPTDERVRESRHRADPQLASLYFQYGRYLLISSSRPGTQPANLQGIWNDSLNPPWGSKYTININTEMNYWPAEVANLAECAEPLFGLIEDLTHTGARMARSHYGTGGWVAHHNTDLWRATGPIDGAFYGVWPTGGAWLCRHLWEHYLYGGDREFLARVYPWMKDAAQFFLENLVEDAETGWLVTSPSLSPENAHHPGVSLVAGPTMDAQILRDLFTQCIEAAGLLDRDAAWAAELTKVRDRLPPNQIGAAGQLQEWLKDWDLQAPEQDHRHVSHLYGLYPSAQINPDDTPALAAAARRSLELRGDEATGWGIGWRLNLWARLREPERAHEVLRLLLGPTRTYPNLMDAHPPFQIDGNFGGTAAIAEMLLQSHRGELHLLPALPQAWPAGSVRGLRARGGYEVDLEWRDGRVQQAVIRSTSGRNPTLRVGERRETLAIEPGGTVTWRAR